MVLLGLLYIGQIGAISWIFRGFRRLSALVVGITGALANVTCFLVCVYFLRFGELMLLVWFVCFPVILGAGSAWAVGDSTKCDSSAIIRRGVVIGRTTMTTGLAPVDDGVHPLAASPRVPDFQACHGTPG